MREQREVSSPTQFRRPASGVPAVRPLFYLHHRCHLWVMTSRRSFLTAVSQPRGKASHRSAFTDTRPRFRPWNIIQAWLAKAAHSLVQPIRPGAA